MATTALNRLEPVYYRVELHAMEVDNVSPEQYAAANSNTFPTTLTTSLDIERANMRWDAVVRKLGDLLVPLFTVAFNSPNRDEDTPETELAFTVSYDRPEFLDTEDELSAPARLTGADCVKRLVARALINDEVENRQIFDPEVDFSGGPYVNGPQIREVTATKINASIATVEANITVTEITNVDDKP